MNQQNQRMGLRMWQRIVFVMAMVSGLTAQAQTQPAIEGVTGSIQGGTAVVRIDLSEALTAVPTGFVIQSPARIALDFPGHEGPVARRHQLH